MHHGALEGRIFACPVKALARRVTHIWVHTYNGKTLFCAYWDSFGRGDVTDRDIIFHMKLEAAKLGYPSRNIPLDRIDMHLKRSGEACAMKLAVFNDESIRKMGIWLPPSNYILVYIQKKRSRFSQGMITKMTRIKRFTNKEGSENHKG